MSTITDVVKRLKKRRDGITAFLRDSHPEIFNEQKHLDSDTTERAYWHYGYLMAIRDFLALLSAPDDTN